jgi:hypothetical protein
MNKFSVSLTSEQILALNLSNDCIYGLYSDIQKNSDVNSSDILLYQKSVNARIEMNESLYYIRQLGWLSEEAGLSVLKDMDSSDMKRIAEYQVPQSHLNYINSLSMEDKSELKGSFLGSQIEIEFVPKTKPITLDVKAIEGNTLVVLPERTDYFSKFIRLGDKKGYVVDSIETTTQLETLIYQIEVAKEKAIFKNPGSGTWWKFFGMPTIEPIFSETEFNFSVKGDWREASIEVNGKVVTGFQIVGDLESIENLETESIYRSNYSENQFIIQVAKDLGIKSFDETYVVKGSKAVVEAEYWRRMKEFQVSGVAEIQEYATSLGLNCEVSTHGLKFYPSILVKEGEFEFKARLESRYGSYSVEMAKEWLEGFNEEDVKDSYAWEQAYEQFLAKDLPTV